MISRDRIWRLRKLIEQAAASFDDATALEGIELFPNWVTDTAYEVGVRIKYNNVLYKCIQAHTSQDSWTPDLTPALWTPVSIDEWPEWRQPLGSQDSYMVGDKVSHNNKHWISNTNYNIWEPGVYGWDEAT